MEIIGIGILFALGVYLGPIVVTLAGIIIVSTAISVCRLFGGCEDKRR